MATYVINASIEGEVYAEIEAESEDAAKAIFRDKWYEGIKITEAYGEGYTVDIIDLEIAEMFVEEKGGV